LYTIIPIGKREGSEASNDGRPAWLQKGERLPCD
jgi:hypothetical protein